VRRGAWRSEVRRGAWRSEVRRGRVRSGGMGSGPSARPTRLSQTRHSRKANDGSDGSNLGHNLPHGQIPPPPRQSGTPLV
jgi:hypothetical protein